MTLLFYVDESRERDIHVHAGILVDGAAAANLEAEVDRIIASAAAAEVCASATAELHGSEIFNRRGEWTSGSIAARVQVIDAALESIGSLGAEVLSRGINISDFRARYGGDPYANAFSNLLERVNSRLAEREQFGLIIADQQHQYAELLRDNLQNARKWGTSGWNSSKLHLILDTVHFVDSKRSRLTQLADVVAFLIRRRAIRAREANDELENVMARWNSLIDAAVPDHKERYRSIWTKA